MTEFWILIILSGYVGKLKMCALFRVTLTILFRMNFYHLLKQMWNVEYLDQGIQRDQAKRWKGNDWRSVQILSRQS